MPQADAGRDRGRRFRGLGFILLAALAAGAVRGQAAPESIHHYEVRVAACGLAVAPARQVVPAGFPAALSTRLDLAGLAHTGLGDYITTRYRVQAELYGPVDTGAAPAVLTTVPGEPLVIPADLLTTPGAWHLRNIRLVAVADGRTFLYAEPASVYIDVGGDLLIAYVESRPLTLAEMAAAGVLFDADSYRNYRFVVGFELAGEIVEYAFPILGGLPAQAPAPALELPAPHTRPADDNLSVREVVIDLSGFPLPEFPDRDARIAGLLVIPGNVGFLHQHFQVLLILGNALPPEAGYRLTDLAAEVVLDAPSPLDFAATAGGGNTPRQPVLDAVTGDDTLGPGHNGAAGWILVGRAAGYHEFPVRIEGCLASAAGDVRLPIRGEARAGVAVREDPRFRLTFLHPDRVAQGATYHVTAAVANTGPTAALGFRLDLAGASITGADLLAVELAGGTYDPAAAPVVDADGAVTMDRLAPGEDLLVRYTLRARRAGQVVATWADADNAGLDVGVGLVFGVDAFGQPMNPDTLRLPPAAMYLSNGLAPDGDPYPAALSFLGLCHTLSLSARGDLPAGYRPVRPAAVEALAQAITEAGLAILAGETRPAVLARLAFDVAGVAAQDAGITHILNETQAGRHFVAVLSGEVAPSGDTVTLARQLAAESLWDGGWGMLSTSLAPAVDQTDTIRWAHAEDTNGDWIGWLAADRTDAFHLIGNGTPQDLRLLVPLNGDRYQENRYAFTAPAGDVVEIPAGAGSETAQIFIVDQTDGSVTTIQPIVQQTFSVSPFTLTAALKVNPDLITGADTFGRNVYALFNRPVALNDADAPDRITATENELLLGRPLGSGRILGLVLNKPVGNFGPAWNENRLDLQVAALPASDGAILAPRTITVNLPDPFVDSLWETGARVNGRVRYPTGQAAAGARVELWMTVMFGTRCDVCVSRIMADEDGAFVFPFVYRNPLGAFLRIKAMDGTQREVPLRIEADGQVLELDIVLPGSGSVTGELLTTAGGPLPGVFGVRLICEGDGRTLLAVLDGHRFRADDVAVGGVAVEVVLWNAKVLRAWTAVEYPGDVAAVRVVDGLETLTGTVRDAAGVVAGCPLRLVLESSQNRYFVDERTDSDGRFALYNLPSGPFTLTATHPVLNSALRRQGVLDGTPLDLDLQFSGGGALHGTVVDGAGNPRAFAQVHLRLVENWERLDLDLTADDQGAFVMDPLPAGTYEISATVPFSGLTGHAWAWVSEGDVSLVQLLLTGDEPVLVAGRLWRADGSPCSPNAHLHVGVGGEAVPVDADGRFQLSLTPGGHRFTAWEGMEAEVAELTVTAAGDPLDIRLRGRRTVTGQVVRCNAQGQEVPVQVQLCLGGLKFYSYGYLEYRDTLSTLLSDAEGHFTFRDVLDGNFEIRYEGGYFYAPYRMHGLLDGQDLSDIKILLTDTTAGERRVQGTLYDRFGQTCAAGVPLTLTNGAGYRFEAITEGDGWFEFRGPFPAGRWTLEATDHYRDDRASQELQLPETGDITGIELRMLGRNTLVVSVMTAQGDILDDAVVSITRQGRPAMSRRAESVWETDYAGDPGQGDDPAYVFMELYEGEYAVLAQSIQGPTVQSVSGGMALPGNEGIFELMLTLRPTVDLAGRVLAADGPDGNLQPVPGAEVTLVDTRGEIMSMAVTRDDAAGMGRFVLPAVGRGEYVLQAHDFASGRRTAQAITIDPAVAPTQVDLVLEELGSVDGLAVTGDPAAVDCATAISPGLAGVPVTLRIQPQPGSAYPAFSAETRTGLDGRFHFGQIPAGHIEVDVVTPAGQRGFAAGDLSTDNAYTLCLVAGLVPVHPVTGRVVQPDGRPAAAARVELRPVAAGRIYQTVTNTDGQFECSDVLEGEYTIAAWTGSGMNRAAAPLWVGGPASIQLELKGLGAVQGRLLYHDELEPVAGQVVSYTLPLADPDFVVETVTAADGSFNFPEVPAGEFLLQGTDRVHQLTGNMAGQLSHGHSWTDIIVALEPSFDLAGFVYTEAGGAIAVDLTYDGVRPDGRAFQRAQLTGDTGSFHMEKVPLADGRLQIDATALAEGRLHRMVSTTGLTDCETLDLGLLQLDKTPPVVAQVNYTAGLVQYPESAVGLDANIHLVFSETMMVATITDQVTLEIMGDDPDVWTPVPVSLISQPDDVEFLVAPGTLLHTRRYRLTVGEDVTDSNGNSLGDPDNGVDERFVTPFDTVDLTPPVVVETTPVDGTIEVNPDHTAGGIVVRFDETMDPLSAGTILVMVNGQGASIVNLAWSEADTLLRFELSPALATDSVCEVWLGGWTDRGGNAMAELAFAFETRDTQPPAVQAAFCDTTIVDLTGQPLLTFIYADALRGVDETTVQGWLSDRQNLWPMVAINPAGSGQADLRPADLLPDGVYTAHLHVADRVGNGAEFTCDFTYSHDPIKITAVSPTGVVVDNAPVPLAISFTSVLGVADSTVLVDGAVRPDAVLMPVGGEAWEISLLHEPAVDGQVTVTGEISDPAGNREDFDFSFIWDGLPPQLAVDVPVGEQCSPRPPITFTASDAGTGVDSAGWAILMDGEDWTAAFQTSGAGGYWLQDRDLTAGAHTLSIQVADAAGHVTIAEATVVVDAQAPAVTIEQPAPGQEIFGDEVAFRIGLADECDLDRSSLVIRLNGAVRSDFQPDAQDIVALVLPWDDPDLQVGTNGLTVQIADAMGNTALQERVFTIVRTAPLPMDLADANGYRFRVLPDGRVSWKALAADPAGAALPVTTIWRDGNPYPLAERPEGVVALGQREVRLDGPVGSADLRHEKRVYVAGDGYFVRIQERLENASAQPVVVTLEQAYILPETWAWQVTESSSGDAVADITDTWLMVDDALDLDDAVTANVPALALQFGAPGAVWPSPDEILTLADRIVLRWQDVTVPAAVDGRPGQCLWLTALSAQPTRMAALAALERLVGPPADMFMGIHEAEWPDFINADLVAGPDVSLPELPPLTGGVAGSVSAGTPEAQPLAWRELWLASECAVFSRYRTVITQGAGEFLYPAADGQIRLPADNLAIMAPCSGSPAWDVALSAQSPVAGDLELTAVGSGTLDVQVRISTGEYVPATVALVSVDGSCALEDVAPGDPDAVPAVLAGLAPGDYELHVSSVFGETSRGVAIAPAETQSLEIVLTERFLAGRIVNETGAAMAAVDVYVFPYCYGCRPEPLTATVTDENGVFVFLNLPVDERVDVVALHADGRWAESVYHRVPPEGSLWLDDMELQPAGVLRVRTQTMAGLPIDVAAVSVEFADYVLPVAAGETGEGGIPGEVTFQALPAGHAAGLTCLVQLPGQALFPPLHFGMSVGVENQLLFTDGGGNFTLTGHLFGADGTTALGGQHIQLQAEIAPDEYAHLDTTTVQSSGGFQFERGFLPTGRGRIVVPWPGSMGAGEESLTVDATQGTVLTLTSHIPVVSGTVMDAMGQTVSAATQLQVIPHDPDLARLGSNQMRLANGMFTACGLLPGLAYDFSARDAAAGFYCAVAEIPAGQLTLTGVELVPCDDHYIGGTLFAADGMTPANDIRVALEKELSPDEYLTVGEQWTDSDGVFLFSNIVFPTGRARLIIHLPESQGGGVEDVIVDVVHQPEITLTTGISILKGQVVNEYGAAGADILDFEVETCSPQGIAPLADHIRLSGAQFTILGLEPGQNYNFTAVDLDDGFHCATGGLATGVLADEGWLVAPCVRFTVSGTLLAADGTTPVPYNLVECFREVAEDYWQSVGQVHTNTAGAFERPDLYLPTGRVRLLSLWPLSQGEGQDERVADLTVEPQVDFVTRVTVVHGHVHDGSGQPVADIDHLDVSPLRAESWPPAVKVYADGTFSVIGVPPAVECDYVAVDPAGQAYCQTMAIPTGQDVTTGVVLTPCTTCLLTGTLVAADGTTALDVPGHRVELWREVTPGQYVFARRTTASWSGGPGEFAFWNVPLPTGRARLRTPWPDSQGSGGDELAVDFSGQVQLDVTFPTTISLVRGYAVDGGSVPVPVCDLMVLGDDVLPQRIPWQQLLVEDDGTWWVAGLQPGRMYDFIAFADDGPEPAVYCARTGLSAGQLVRTDVTLPPCGPPTNIVRVRVVNPEGDPLPLLYVHLSLDDACGGGYLPVAQKQLFDYWDTTDETGWTEFANLVPGAYVVEVSDEGFEEVTYAELLVPLDGGVLERVVIHDMSSPSIKTGKTLDKKPSTLIGQPGNTFLRHRQSTRLRTGPFISRGSVGITARMAAPERSPTPILCSPCPDGRAMAAAGVAQPARQAMVAPPRVSLALPSPSGQLDASAPGLSRPNTSLPGYELPVAEDK